MEEENEQKYKNNGEKLEKAWTWPNGRLLGFLVVEGLVVVVPYWGV
jgi:hypothetical protein